MSKVNLSNQEIIDFFLKIYREKGTMGAARQALKDTYGIEIDQHNSSSRDIIRGNTSTTARDILRKKGTPSENFRFTSKGSRDSLWEKDDFPMMYNEMMKIIEMHEKGMDIGEIVKRTGWSEQLVERVLTKPAKKNYDVDAFGMFKQMAAGSEKTN